MPIDLTCKEIGQRSRNEAPPTYNNGMICTTRWKDLIPPSLKVVHAIVLLSMFYPIQGSSRIICIDIFVYSDVYGGAGPPTCPGIPKLHSIVTRSCEDSMSTLSVAVDSSLMAVEAPTLSQKIDHAKVLGHSAIRRGIYRFLQHQTSNFNVTY